MGIKWSNDANTSISSSAYCHFGSTKAMDNFYDRMLQVAESLMQKSELTNDMAQEVEDTKEAEIKTTTLSNWDREASFLNAQSNTLYPPYIWNTETIASLISSIDTPSVSPNQVKLNSNSSVQQVSDQELQLQGLCENPMTTSDSLLQGINNALAIIPDISEKYRLLEKYPKAARLYLYQKQVVHRDATVGPQYYLTIGSYSEAAKLIGKVASGYPNQQQKEMLVLVSKCQSHIRPFSRFSLTKSQSQSSSSTTFDALMTKCETQLRARQNEIEAQLGIPIFYNCSVVESIHKLIYLYPMERKALGIGIKLSKEFSITPQQFYWALLHAFTRNECYKTLLQLIILATKLTPPDIGYLPIIRVFLKANEIQAAKELAATINNQNTRKEVEEFITATLPLNDEGIPKE